MKQNILFVIALFLGTTVIVAQNLDFSESPVVVTGIQSTDFEGVGYSTLTNTAAEDRSFVWTRNIVEKTETWNIAVCDNIQCYAPSTGTSNFSITANGTSPMDVHAYPNQTDGSAVVEITVTDAADDQLTLTNLYYFNTTPSSTTQASRQTIKVYPNPSNGLFSVKGGKQIANVQVFSLTGRQVKSFTYNDGQWYDISDLPTGTYLVRLVDRDAQQLVTKLMNKL